MALATSKEQVLRHIVLAVDTSTDSEYTVDWCIANIYREGDFLHLLHCVPSTSAHVPVAAPMGHLHYAPLPPHHDDEKIVAAAKERVHERFGSELAAASIPFEVKVMCDWGVVFGGGVGDKICDAASELDAAAVVVAAHRKSPFAEFVMGSVSNFLVHHCAQPVLVLHAPRSPESDGHLQATGARNIAVAVDSTKQAEVVCRWALQNVFRPGDALHALHVVPSQPEAIDAGAYSVFAEDMTYMNYRPRPTEQQLAAVASHREALNTAFNSCLQTLVAQSDVSDLSVHIVQASVTNPMGSVGRAICNTCASLNAAALVMVSGHKGPFAELFMGSVTSYCTHHCESPVLVLT